jgi:hypothetical protein
MKAQDGRMNKKQFVFPPSAFCILPSSLSCPSLFEAAFYVSVSKTGTRFI